MNPEQPATPDQTQADQPAQTPKKAGKSMLPLIVVFALVLTGLVSAWVIYTDNNKTVITTKIPVVASAPAKVSIAADGFTPANLDVTIGTTVTWTNTDSAPHRVASDPYPTNDGLPGFDSKEALQTNDTYTYKFEKAGTFGYHDEQHPLDIKGTVTVSPATRQ